MDPNEVLTEIRTLVEWHTAGTRSERDARLQRLGDLVNELDVYLTAGGTPPEEWREGPDAPGEACPNTGRTASACTFSDHRDCPNLRLRHVLARVASGNITPDELQRELDFNG